MVAVDPVLSGAAKKQQRRPEPTTASIALSCDDATCMAAVWDDDLLDLLLDDRAPRHRLSPRLEAVLMPRVLSQAGPLVMQWYAVDLQDGDMLPVQCRLLAADLEAAFARPDDLHIVRTKVVDAGRPVAKSAAEKGTVAFECVAAAEVEEGRVLGIYNRVCRMYLQEEEKEYEDAAYQVLSDSTMLLRIADLNIIVDVLPVANPLTMMNDPSGSGHRPNCRMMQFVRVSSSKVDVVIAPVASRRIRIRDEVTYDYGKTYWPKWAKTQRVRDATCRAVCDKMRAVALAHAAPIVCAGPTPTRESKRKQ